MPIISVEIMETLDEREIEKTTKEKQAKPESSKGNRSYSEKVRAKWTCCAFKLGFLQLICKASLLFKSNLELALSIILKQRKLSKHVAVECRCLKIWDLLCFLICSSILVFKMTANFANIARTAASTSNFICKERFQIIKNWVFIWNIIFNFEWIKT